MDIEININEHFADFIVNWDCYEYFLLGGYGSSKSYGVSVKLVTKAMAEKRNILVIRQVHSTHKDSTYADIKDAVNICGLDKHFVFRKSALEVECMTNGSKFIFRGLDDWRKLKSIKDVSIVWIEEGEGSMEAYKELKDRMRAFGLDVHIIVSTNPKPKKHWVYKRYIEEMGITEEQLYTERRIIKDGVYLHHSTYKDNAYLNDRWIKNLEAETDPTMVRVKKEGKFGSDGVKVLRNLKKMDADLVNANLHELDIDSFYTGMDWGFQTSYNACIEVAVDDRNPFCKKLYIFSEYYTRELTNAEIIDDLNHFRVSRQLITADSAEPKTIREFANAGFNIRKCKKFQGSVKYNVMKLKGFHEIIISTDCPNTWDELDDLMYKKDKYNEIIEDEFNIDAHTKDAIVYALDQYHHEDLKDYRGYVDEYFERGIS